MIPSKEQIEQALAKHWNIKPAAEELKIGYSTLRKYIKQHGIVHNSRKKQGGSTFNKSSYSSKRTTEHRKKRKIDSLIYKGGMKCMRCGFSEPIPDCYAFHHRDPSQKDPNYSKMKTQCWSWERTKAELDKCDVLCHNCHSIVHYNQRTK